MHSTVVIIMFYFLWNGYSIVSLEKCHSNCFYMASFSISNGGFGHPQELSVCDHLHSLHPISDVPEDWDPASGSTLSQNRDLVSHDVLLLHVGGSHTLITDMREMCKGVHVSSVLTNLSALENVTLSTFNPRSSQTNVTYCSCICVRQANIVAYTVFIKPF